MRSLKVIGLVMVMLYAGTASAFAFHKYSQADDNGYVNHYTGLSVTRPDRSTPRLRPAASPFTEATPSIKPSGY